MNAAQCSCCQSSSGLMAGFLAFSTPPSDSPVSCSHVGGEHIQPPPANGDREMKPAEFSLLYQKNLTWKPKTTQRTRGKKGGGASFTLDRKCRARLHMLHMTVHVCPCPFWHSGAPPTLPHIISEWPPLLQETMEDG